MIDVRRRIREVGMITWRRKKGRKEKAVAKRGEEERRKKRKREREGRSWRDSEESN